MAGNSDVDVTVGIEVTTSAGDLRKDIQNAIDSATQQAFKAPIRIDTSVIDDIKRISDAVNSASQRIGSSMSDLASNLANSLSEVSRSADAFDELAHKLNTSKVEFYIMTNVDQMANDAEQITKEIDYWDEMISNGRSLKYELDAKDCVAGLENLNKAILRTTNHGQPYQVTVNANIDRAANSIDNLYRSIRGYTDGLFSKDTFVDVNGNPLFTKDFPTTRDITFTTNVDKVTESVRTLQENLNSLVNQHYEIHIDDTISQTFKAGMESLGKLGSDIGVISKLLNDLNAKLGYSGLNEYLSKINQVFATTSGTMQDLDNVFNNTMKAMAGHSAQIASAMNQVQIVVDHLMNYGGSPSNSMFGNSAKEAAELRIQLERMVLAYKQEGLTGSDTLTSQLKNGYEDARRMGKELEFMRNSVAELYEQLRLYGGNTFNEQFMRTPGQIGVNDLKVECEEYMAVLQQLEPLVTKVYGEKQDFSYLTGIDSLTDKASAMRDVINSLVEDIRNAGYGAELQPIMEQFARAFSNAGVSVEGIAPVGAEVEEAGARIHAGAASAAAGAEKYAESIDRIKGASGQAGGAQLGMDELFAQLQDLLKASQAVDTQAFKALFDDLNGVLKQVKGSVDEAVQAINLLKDTLKALSQDKSSEVIQKISEAIQKMAEAANSSGAQSLESIIKAIGEVKGAIDGLGDFSGALNNLKDLGGVLRQVQEQLSIFAENSPIGKTADDADRAAGAIDHMAESGGRTASIFTNIAENAKNASAASAEMQASLAEYNRQKLAGGLITEAGVDAGAASALADSFSSVGVHVDRIRVSLEEAGDEAQTLNSFVITGSNSLGQTLQYLVRYDSETGDISKTLTNITFQTDAAAKNEEKAAQAEKQKADALKSYIALQQSVQGALNKFASYETSGSPELREQYNNLQILSMAMDEYRSTAESAGTTGKELSNIISLLSLEFSRYSEALTSDANAQQAFDKSLQDISKKTDALRAYEQLRAKVQGAITQYGEFQFSPSGTERDAFAGLQSVLRILDDYETKARSTSTTVADLKETLSSCNLEFTRNSNVLAQSAASQKSMSQELQELTKKEDALRAYEQLRARMQSTITKYGAFETSPVQGERDAFAGMQSTLQQLTDYETRARSAATSVEDLRETLSSCNLEFTKYSNVLAQSSAEQKASDKATQDMTKKTEALRAYDQLYSKVQQKLIQYSAIGNSNNAVDRENYENLRALQTIMQEYYATAESTNTSSIDLRETISGLSRDYDQYSNALQRSIDRQKEQDRASADNAARLQQIGRLTDMQGRVNDTIAKYTNSDDAQIQSAIAGARELQEQIRQLQTDANNSGMSAQELKERINELAVAERNCANEIRNSNTVRQAQIAQLREQAAQNRAQAQLSGTLMKVQTALTNYGAGNNSMNPVAKQAYQGLENLEAKILAYQDALKNTGATTEEVKTQNSQFAAELKSLSAQLQGAGAANKTFGQRIGEMTRMFASWFSGSRIVLYVVRMLKNMVKTTIELDDAMTQMQIVTHASDTAMSEFATTAAEAAKSVGASVTDFINSATTFARLGYSMDESSTLAKLTSMISNVGDIDVSDMQDAMTAILKAFSGEVDVSNIESVMDKLVIVGKMIAQQYSNVLKAMGYIGQRWLGSMNH